MGTTGLLDNPLRRKIDKGDSVCHYFGYRSVCLRPNDGDVPADILKLLPPHTIAVNIDAKAHVKTISIFAEEILFVGGCTYKFEEKNLNVHCSTARFCGPAKPVVIDLGGRQNTTAGASGESASGDATDASYDVALGSDGRPQRYTDNRDQVGNIRNRTQASRGKRGSDGSPGRQGGNGGSFNLTCNLSIPEQEIGQTKFLIITSGGAGSSGGAGGQGGRGGGGSVLRPPHPENSDPAFRDHWLVCPEAFASLLSLITPGFGGDGGNPGAGGWGGSGGNITIKFLLNGRQATAEETKAIFPESSTEASAGPKGNDGGGGEVGEPGQQSYWGLRAYHWPDVAASNMLYGMKQQSIDWLDYVDSGSTGKTFTTRRYVVKPLGEKPKPGSVIANNAPPPSPGKVVVEAAMDWSSLRAHVVQLSMIVNRLHFEYFVHFTTQAYTLPNNDKTMKLVTENFATSFAWARASIDSISKGGGQALDPSERLLFKIVENNFSQLAMFQDQQVDIFGNGLTTVAQPGLSVSRTRATLEKFLKIEAQFEKTSLELLSTTKAREGMRGELIDALGRAKIEVEKQNTAINNLDDLQRQIVQADNLVNSRRDYLKKRLQNFEATIEAQVNCEVTDILNGLSNIHIGSNPERNAVSAISALASIAGGAQQMFKNSFESIRTKSGRYVEKKLLYSRIHTIFDNTVSVKESLAEELKRAKGEKSRNPDYLSQVRVQAEKFNQMCDDYFAGFPKEVAMSRDSFDQLINAIQAKSDLLDSYNQMVINIASSQHEIQRLEHASDIFRDKLASDKMQDDELQLAFAFLEQIRADMKRFVLWNLYNLVRTFNCMALRRSNLMSAFASLQSFHELDATNISSAFDTYFETQDLNNLKQFWGVYRSTETKPDVPDILILTEGEYPDLFRELRETGRFTVTFDYKTVTKLGWPINRFDIRYKSAEVYFPGAFISNTSHHTDRPIISMTIGTTGRCSILDDRFHVSEKPGDQKPDEEHPRFGVHKFDLGRSFTPFSYTYNPKSLGTVGLKRQSAAKSSDSFKFELEENHAFDIYLQSPLTTWTIKLSDVHSEEGRKRKPELVNKVDLEHCWKIEFRFQLVYRGVPT